MGDLIERQAAIDAVEYGITYAKAINKSTGEVKELFKEGNKALNEAVERIKDLPSAQSERQKGEWIDYTEDGYVECPFCHSATNCDGNKDELHFCFSCGADMRGKQDG